MQRFFVVFSMWLYVVVAIARADSIPVQQIDEIVISKTHFAPTSKANVPVQSVTVEDMERIGVQSLADAVRRFAGVTVKDYGGLGGLKTVSFRGLDAQHTGVSYDGINIGEAQSGQVDIGKFSLENVSTISFSISQPGDILQSARYFSSASTLNIKTGQPVFENKSYKAKISTKTGSFGYFAPSVYYLQKLNTNWAASVSGEWQRTDGKYPFDFKSGSYTEKRKRKNSDVNTWRTEANVYGHLKNAGKLNIKANHYDTERGLPGSTISNNQYSGERLADRDFFIQSLYQNDFNRKFSIQALAKFSGYNKKYTDVSIKDTTNSRYRQFEYYTSVAALYNITDELAFSFAQDYIRNALDLRFSDKEEISDTWINSNKTYRNSWYTALNAKYIIRRLGIYGGLLFGYFGESAERGNNPPDKNRLSPSLSVTYKPFDESFMLRASYKDIYRVPTMDDLYYTQIGNTGLKPEIARQWNAGFTWAGSINGIFDYLSLSIDGYLNKAKDKIIPASVSLFQWKMKNIDNVTIKGFDVTLTSEINPGRKITLFFNGNYSYRYARDDDTRLYLRYTPKHAGSGSAGIENPFINLSYSLVYSSKTYSDYPMTSLNKIDSFFDHTVSVNKSFKWNSNNLRLQAEIINLAGDNYQIVKNYPMPGRHFRCTATYKF